MAKKNVVINIVIVLIVIVFLAAVIGIISADSILRSAIQTAIKKQLNVDSTVAKVSLKILNGTIEISDLKIKNPDGYQFDNILETRSIFVKTTIRGLLSNPVEIEQIKIDGIAMSIEQKGLSNNINDILKGMPSKEKTEPATQESARAAKNVHIAVLDINDIDVNVKLIPLPGKSDTVTLSIASLHFTDIGGDNSLAQIIGRVFTEITNAVVKNGGGILPSDMMGSLEKGVQQQFEQLSGQGQKILEKAGEDLKQKADEALKGIFQKK